MAFEFIETATIALPDVSSKVHELTENEAGRTKNKILTEIAAIHVGLTANFNMYTEEGLTNSVNTWTTPYPKPIIVNHDEFTDPLGRVMAAKMAKESDGTPYIAIQAAILDPTAIERVLDERYITGSVGGKAESAKCSICGTDWAKAPVEQGLPCRHKRGQVYEGKLAYLELGEITWKEFSFVNVPADTKARILATDSKERDSWASAAKIFCLDMEQEAILSLTESDAPPSNVLSNLKKPQAAYTYRNIKGTFLTTEAYDLENDINENLTFVHNNSTIDNETQMIASVEENKLMPKEQNELTNQDEDKDILDVADELFGGVGENDATEDETEKDSEEVSDDADSDEEKDLSEESTEAEEESAESSDQTDSEAEEQESAENQSEEEDNQDSSDEATTESETEEQEEKDESLIEDSEQDSNESEDESAQVSQADESQEQVDEKAEETESEVEETVDELTKLRQENARLRAHLHYMLAERVVDAKIAIGLVDPAERHAELAEHEKRSAGSLADALKDIERFSAVMPNRGVANPSELMNSKLEVTSSEEGVIEGEVEEQEEEKPVSPQTKLEEYVTDVLMGRRKLVNGPIK